jgi:stage II sporulation protein D
MRLLLCLLLLTVSVPASAATGVNPTLAIGIFSDKTILACTITSQTPLKLQDEQGRQVAELPAGALLAAGIRDEKVTVSCERPRGGGRADTYLISSASPIQIRLGSGKPRSYRGKLSISARRGHLALVDQIPLEDYLRGVLPSEIPTSFEPEALRAQAIAARTYAIMVWGRHRQDGYDLCDLPHCQAYLGVEGESRRTDSAVSQSAGLIVTYQHKPIYAVYHDSCGGRTAGNETAWQGSDPLPYLRPVLDGNGAGAFCDRSPRAVWTRQIPQAKVAASLARSGVSAPISAIEPVSRDENGRPQGFIIRGSEGDVTIKAGVLRDAVNRALGPAGLPSADFTAAPNGDLLVFAGRGNGHGVGLCQWGANAMAKAGHTAAAILTHYYSGVTVEPVSTEVIARLNHLGTG